MLSLAIFRNGFECRNRPRSRQNFIDLNFEGGFYEQELADSKSFGGLATMQVGSSSIERPDKLDAGLTGRAVAG